ncbi:MAG: EthD family reductase [Bacteroidota bacterium]
MKIKTIFLVLSVFVFLTSWHPMTLSEASEEKEGLIKIAIMYPNAEGKTFDMEYYSEKHMPMVAELFGEGLKGLEIDKGIAGRTPEEPMPYLAVGYFYFDSLEAYQNAFGPNAEQILGDIPNYTNIQPVVQISEVIR